MMILTTISCIINLLAPLVWLVLFYFNGKKEKFENLFFILTILFIIVGLVSCFNSGLNLFVLE